MDFSWNEEQRMLKDAARKFFDKECPRAWVKEIMTDPTSRVPELWQKMADLGWLGLIFEEAYGGSAGGFTDLAVLMEEMGRAAAPGPYFSAVIQAGLTLAASENAELKEKYLPLLCEGKNQGTLAVIEAGGRWSGDGVQTRAEKSADGFLISGRKMFVLDAHEADYLLVAARRGPADADLILVLVDLPAPGVTVKPLRTISGEKQFEVILEETPVPAKSVVGPVGRGWSLVERTYPRMLIARSAQMVGAMEQVLDMTVAYTRERQQFGVPIGVFQAIQHSLVDMLLQIETSRYLTYLAAWKAQENFSCQKEASMAKAACSDAFQMIAAAAHQVFGGIGFTEEHDLHIFSKHGKGWQLTLGDAPDHRRIVAEAMSG